MPLQNRVTPFGDIVAIPQKGLFTGNRGIIHDPETRTLLRRRWVTKAWIVCRCDYKGVRRRVMATRSWTELFFLDEATALAAGHRPCFYCRREAANAFRAAWASGNGVAAPAAREIDAVLHRERLEQRQKKIHPMTCALEQMPDGAMVTSAGEAYLLVGGRAFRWTADGYGPAGDALMPDGLITPPSTLAALAAGYRPALHPSLSPAPARTLA